MSLTHVCESRSPRESFQTRPRAERCLRRSLLVGHGTVPDQGHVPWLRGEGGRGSAAGVAQLAAALEPIVPVGARAARPLGEVPAAKQVGPPVRAVVVHDRRDGVRLRPALQLQLHPRLHAQRPRHAVPRLGAGRRAGPAQLHEQQRREGRRGGARAQPAASAARARAVVVGAVCEVGGRERPDLGRHSGAEQLADVVAGEEERQVEDAARRGDGVLAGGARPRGAGGEVEGARGQVRGEEVLEELLGEAEAVSHQPADLATAGGATRASTREAGGARAAAAAAAVAERRSALVRRAPLLLLLRLLGPHARVPEALCGCGARRIAAPQAERLNHGLPRALARPHGARRLNALPGDALAGLARSGAAGMGRLSRATSAGADRLDGAAAELPPLLPRQRMAQHREQRVDWAAEGRRSVLEACQRLHRGRGAKARLVCGRRERQRVHRRQPPTAPHHAMPPVGAGVGRRRGGGAAGLPDAAGPLVHTLGECGRGHRRRSRSRGGS
mmetsp:Transcript_4843/g.15731  ORF Transcript_4843/g.15731 Transcript_4843/m.15731 type:complete len:502 (-) Transcript_4843:207-1712(-)